MKSEANVSPTAAVRTVIDGLSSFQLFSFFVPSFSPPGECLTAFISLQRGKQVSSSLGTKELSITPVPFNHRAVWTVPSSTQYLCVRLSPKFINRHTVLSNMV